ncbi:uncharacterized protein LOC142663993 [Rhinoderma darwinii]|uniref:uncharacterized protein LOC142663993 n=1 Tax=Rhinoderma darwinii TaxID=43563 RepID=UPI003F674FB1
MESILKDEQGPEQEAVSLQGTVTSTCRGSKETDHRGLSYETVMESNSDLLDNLLPPTVETLTNEIVNTGTQGGISSCHKGSSQGSPSNDNTEETCDAALPGELESFHGVVERHTNTERRHLKEENKTTDLETSSDDTDEWETASEESVALEEHTEIVDIKVEKENGDEQCDRREGSPGQKLTEEPEFDRENINRKPMVKEKSDFHEESAACQVTLGNERIRGDTGSYGQEKVNEDAGPPGEEKHGEDARPHCQENVNEVTELYGQETVSMNPEPHGLEPVSEEAGSHGLEPLDEEAGPQGLEPVGEEAGPQGLEPVGEEAGPQGLEPVSEEAGPQGLEPVGEEAGPQALEPVGEEAEPLGLEPTSEQTLPCGLQMSSEESETLSHDTVIEETESHVKEIVSEENCSPGMETDNLETMLYSPETSGDDTRSLVHETVSDLVQPLGNETVGDMTRLHDRIMLNSDLQDNESFSGITSEEFDKDCEISFYQYNIGAVPDAPLNYIVVTLKEETTNDEKDTTAERPDENRMGNSEEILDDKTENLRNESKSDSKHDETPKYIETIEEGHGDYSETFSDGTNSGHCEMVCQDTHDVCRDSDETLDSYTEPVNEEGPNVCKEISQEKSQVVPTESVNEEKQDVYDGIDSPPMRVIYKETVLENTLQETLTSDSEDTEVGDINPGEVEISKRMEEVLSEDPILIEPSSDEREMAKKQVQIKANEDYGHNDELSEASRLPVHNIVDILKESAINKNDLDDDNDSKQKWDIAETSSKPVLTEDMEIARLECERLEEKLHSIKTLKGTGEGRSDDLPITMNQETVVEMQYSTPVNIDEKSYMDIEAQLDASGLPVTEEKGQEDYAKTLSGIEIKSIAPEYIKPADTENEPSNNLELGYNAEPKVQVLSSDDLGFREPCLQLSGLLTEQSTHSKDDSIIDFQNLRLDGPKQLQEEPTTVEMLEPHNSPCSSQVDQSTQELSEDEPDHCKLAFFPTTLKNIGFISEDMTDLGLKNKAHGLLPESRGTILEDTKCITIHETTHLPLQESLRESVYHKSTLGEIHPVVDRDQDTMTPDSETAKTTATNSENIKIFRRQRSNTDPCLIHDQDENQQAGSNVKGSSSGRLRSLTPPCDKFTSSFTPTSLKNIEHTPTSVLYPMPDENKSSHSARDTKSAKEYTFYPTQIFNPMLLLGHTHEESGFYQKETFEQGNVENANQGYFKSSPKDNQVLLHTQNPESIVVGPEGSSTEGISNTKPMSDHLVAPLWLPPRPSRYIGDTGGVNEIGPTKTPDNPLVRRATIRHKRSNVGARPTTKRFSSPNLPAIPQKDYPVAPRASSLPQIQLMNVNKIQISSKNRPLFHQQNIPENRPEIVHSRSSSSMETVREEGHPKVKEKPSNSPESVLLRGTRSKTKPPSSDSSQSIHRRYSTFINSSNLLYQEYSDVALNQEIQRQKPGDSPAEDSQPSSPRVRRRILSSQDSYLQRLSISSADSLWQDIPKIRDSVTFLSMTREEQKLQEAKFELIMSEALYLRSLNIAVDHFQRSAELQEVLSAQDRQWLFSRLSEVRDASSDFLFDLEEEFESNMYKFQVCDLVIAHESTFRRVYLPYVTNQSYQDRTFQRLMNGNPRFQQVLAKLESDPVCQRLSLKSFLILPFQRITRLRLLLQNILKRSAPGSTKELQATDAHNALEKLIRDCNESVQRMKDTEELILLNQKIQFECKIFPLISQSRRLVKHGEVTSLEYNSMSFKWKVTTRPVYLHLFNDCLLLSRVKEGGRFVVFDHSSEVRVERCEIKLHTNQKNIFRVFLRDSSAMGRESTQDGRETEYMFRTETQSQKLRWICALSSPKEEIDFWRDHGLSQMQCLKSYKARENDELSLEKADILMVTQNSDDGWLHGIRLSDQQSGWFPHCNVQPISRNACLRNLQEEQRLQTARAKLQPTGAKGQ